MAGAHSEVFRKCTEASKEKGVPRIRVVDVDNHIICDTNPTEFDSSLKISKKIFFDEEETSVAATIDVYFSNSKTKSVVNEQKIIFGALFLCSVAFFAAASYFVGRKVTNPLTELSWALQNESLDETSNSLSQMNSSGIFEVDLFKEKLIDYSIALKKSNQRLEYSTKKAAIAQTTQMLAHDVRKPFTMLQGILDMLGSASPNEVKEIVGNFVPEVQQSIKSVNGMIADVMEVGSNSEPNKELTNVEVLITNSLNENLRYTVNALISIKYDFNHSHQLFVDNLKVSRVFSNILGNGIQAMRQKGELWINTKESGRMLTVTLGNSNSYIPPEDLKQLFEAFFTKNKKGGTGLGLAIAKKVVNAHGGVISCTSDRKKGTEFHFSLPVSHVASNFNDSLPTSAQEIREQFQDMLNRVAPKECRSNRSDTELENAISKHLKTPIKILVCDDEAVYRNLLNNHVNCSEKIAGKIEVIAVHDGESAILAVKEHDPEIVIMDVDLGKDKIDGFEAVRQIRSLGSKAKICVHSNRGAMEYQEEAVQAGANLFMPKPMGRTHFLNIILGSISKSKNKVPSNGHYVVVDDSPLMLYNWGKLEELKDVKTFQSPEEFWAAVKADSSLLSEALGVVTDNDFDKKSSTSGLEFADELRGKGYQRPIYLASNGDFTDTELAVANLKVVPKLAKDAVAIIAR